MKKVISVITIICSIISSVIFTSSAEDPETLTFYYRHGVEVTVEVNENLTYEQLQRIADHIAGEEVEQIGDQIQLHPQCAAGNHDLVYTHSTKVTHNVYTTSPKCVSEDYRVGTCCRIGCFFVTEELISSIRINTCHG